MDKDGSAHNDRFGRNKMLREGKTIKLDQLTYYELVRTVNGIDKSIVRLRTLMNELMKRDEVYSQELDKLKMKVIALEVENRCRDKPKP
jgi:hypothetical protein